jgi:hypothetical protein
LAKSHDIFAIGAVARGGNGITAKLGMTIVLKDAAVMVAVVHQVRSRKTGLPLRRNRPTAAVI